MNSGTVRAVCISEKKGIQKHSVPQAFFMEEWGIENDAHAGKWHRQVSLLSFDRVQDFNARGAQVQDGAFGENLLVAGIDFRSLPVGTLLRCGDVELRMTQIGKECHTHCAIYQKMGECIMPVQGVFAEVLHSGIIRSGDHMKVMPPDPERPFTAAVITLSDSGAKGERADQSGPLITARLEAEGFEVLETLVLPDSAELLKKELCRLADQRQVSLVLTTGGTGFSPRDNTPEATLAVMTRNAPGIAEAIRAASMAQTKRAMLSRAVSVIRGGTLIVNLPGSPKAVRESMDVFFDTVGHGLKVLRGAVTNCAANFEK
ncbi:MOSC domain-containing protein [Clostridium minihomine]|uniref:MOSC domain-containing protein n=1 Tax=Clostridium minihomine TaxID=2045012 RepID=UPI000C769471|nr:MOSC domain-containing protein [Clostridium minihomine]